MIRRALRGLLNSVRGRRTRAEERVAGTDSRAAASVGPTAQAHSLPDLRTLETRLGITGADDAQAQDDVEEIDRLVELTFGALLRRKPDRDTLLAYREGFANGTTFHDVIDDVLGSEEYRATQQRIKQRRTASDHSSEARLGHERVDEMQEAVALLTTRLVEKGCRPPLGRVAEADRGDGRDGRRMRSLLVTLSALDRL